VVCLSRPKQGRGCDGANNCRFLPVARQQAPEQPKTSRLPWRVGLAGKDNRLSNFLVAFWTKDSDARPAPDVLPGSLAEGGRNPVRFSATE
jgi:hypothetical protein